MINKALVLLVASLVKVCFSDVTVDYELISGDRGMANTCTPVTILPNEYLPLNSTVVYKLMTLDEVNLYRIETEVGTPACLPLSNGYSDVLIYSCTFEGVVRKYKPFSVYNTNNSTGPQVNYRVQATPGDLNGRAITNPLPYDQSESFA